MDFCGNKRSTRTDQQGSFVSVDSGEPQLHVGAAAVLRKRLDDDFLVSSVALEPSTESSPDQQPQTHRDRLRSAL